MSLRRLPPISVGPCMPRTPSTRQSRRYPLYSTTGFGKDVAESAATTAANLHLDLTSTAFALLRRRRSFRRCPTAMSSFGRELRGRTCCCLTLTTRSGACRICGAGGRSPNYTGPSTRRPARPAQWLRAAIEPNEGPDSIGLLRPIGKRRGLILLTSRHRLLRPAFCTHDVCETRRKQPTQPSKRSLKR